ncbi:cytochrome-c peroxidase [Lacinutrix sp. Bg11-31]|uniref:cytochrome-c peroxidase n=1 Tax=Lacinutrix sp. Bg11-31 TaxID=2057808 RepID=UPI000C30CD51|nr:cytochrome c peroxidase [Lacinutrix sp. Bg11-31]AUC82777.1 cytochrome-c peroxidase [Lacinutrix sp. Bg11-31]
MKNWFVYLLLIVSVLACSKNDAPETETYEPTPLALNIPQLFSDNIIAPVIPSNNPQTVEGVALGKKLFFDKKLSGDQTMACVSCHSPQHAFTDNTPTSDGIDGFFGTRNSMPLFNLAWNYGERFTWDGKELSIERQALEPVQNPIEMHSDWNDVVDKLQSDNDYPELFRLAFKTSTITKELTTKALAQFERTLISANSKFDKFSLGTATLTPQEQNGLNVFMDETKGDCFHCHGNPNNPLWTDNIFHNNGLDSNFTDLGLGGVTGDTNDNGKFKSPSLRNLAYTAPYMHDGRFNTIEEVIEFYSTGLQYSSTIDTLMKKVEFGGVNLTEEDKADLKAFLLTLSDPSFLTNPDFQE